MSRVRDELLAAAARRIDDPSEESNSDLGRALESFLRSCGASADPHPAECDGVVLREQLDLEDSVSEFLGFSWLVTNQKVTPLRARFWPGKNGMEFEIRFGISEVQLSRAELDRMCRRGRLPQWNDEWALSLHS